MENILKCRFMRILMRGQKHDYDPNYLLSSYQEFKFLLLSISDEEQNYREKFRTMQSLRRTLEMQLQNIKFQNEHGENIKWFATQALNLISVELDLLDKQLQYPVLFTPSVRSAKDQQSPRHWNSSDYTKTALMSLIVAIDNTNACVDASGNQSPFIAIVNTFEVAFNIKFTNPYKMRDELLSQGDNRTKFIKQLLRALGSN